MSSLQSRPWWMLQFTWVCPEAWLPSSSIKLLRYAVVTQRHPYQCKDCSLNANHVLSFFAVQGSVIYAQASGHSVSTLRNNVRTSLHGNYISKIRCRRTRNSWNCFVLCHQVTSPGGTTASALYELEKGGYRTGAMCSFFSLYLQSYTLIHVDDMWEGVHTCTI